MRYGTINYFDTVDGDGVRVTIWVSGCRNHCRGCFNSQTWDFDYGQEFTPIEENEIIEGCKKSYIKGLTILGGEPFEPENQTSILTLIERFKKECPDKDIWMYTGYILDKDLKDGQRKYISGVTDKIITNIDVLVDGPFIEEQKDLTLKFRGSKNQRILYRHEINTLYK